MESSGGDHIHDEGNEGWRQLKKFDNFLNKMPLEPIISFFKIQFECNIPRPTLLRYKSLNHLMNDDNIIARMTAWHKTSLTGVNGLYHVGFESMNNDTRQQFVKGITDANRTKLSD